VIRQRTVKNAVRIEGPGLQTGASVILDLKSSPADSGINFIRTDLAGSPSFNIRSLDFDGAGLKERRTTIGSGPVEIQTIEHLLSALSGLGIDNVTAEINGPELPGLDGSASVFVEYLKNAGIEEQPAPKRYLKPAAPVWVEGDSSSFIAAFPSDDFRVSYTLSYADPAVGTQFCSVVVDERSFESEIAPARTFCLEEEASELLRRGLGKGANFENTLVLGKSGPVKNVLRFPDEPVRHKILDLIGDLYLTGAPIRAHIVAVKSGHKLNLELVKKLKKESMRWEKSSLT
jgi:UDP-3-O-acyl N-acetylglucosamine deacetylase